MNFIVKNRVLRKRIVVPKISVIIPIFNVEKYINQCLNSLIKQTLNDIEFICIDDCSTDDSFKIIKEYEKKDNRVKVVQMQRNSGQGAARNRGLELAKGEYIGFVDPDDWIEPDMYEKMYNQAKNLESDIVICEYKKYDENTKMYSESKFVHKCNGCNKVEYFNLPVNENINRSIIDNILLVAPCYSWNRIYLAKFILSNNITFSDSKYYEDVMFILRSHLESDKISYMNHEFYNYRIHDSSSLRKNKSDNIKVLPKIIETIFNYLKDNNHERIIKNNLQYFIYTACFVCNREVPFSEKILYFNLAKNFLESKNRKIK